MNIAWAQVQRTGPPRYYASRFLGWRKSKASKQRYRFCVESLNGCRQASVAMRRISISTTAKIGWIEDIKIRQLHKSVYRPAINPPVPIPGLDAAYWYSRWRYSLQKACRLPDRPLHTTPSWRHSALYSYA